MTRKSKARYGLSRTYRVNPTVKALRSAILASAMAAASLVPSVGMAAPPIDVDISYSNSGDAIYANAADLYAYAEVLAVGAYVTAGGTADFTNTGDIEAIANNTGAYYPVYDYDAAGYGIAVLGEDGVTIDNIGSIQANAVTEYGSASSTGIFAADDNPASVGIDVYNSGDIIVYSHSDTAGAVSAGILVNASDNADISNTGNLSITSYGAQDATSGGIVATAYSSVSVDNDGTLSVTASNYSTAQYDSAYAYGILTQGDDVLVENSGVISVAAYAYDAEWTIARAIGIYTVSDHSAAIDNTGDIDVFAANDGDVGASRAYGIFADSGYAINIDNSGDIDIAGTSGGSFYLNYYDGVYLAGDFHADGIRAESIYGDIIITNTGDITITNQNPNGGVAGGLRDGDRFNGIRATTRIGDAVIANAGDVTITGGEIAIGLSATTESVKYAYTCPAPWESYTCYITTGGGDSVVRNSGDINIDIGIETPYDNSYGVGIRARTGKYGGNAIVENTGTINVNVSDGNAIGLLAISNGKYSNGDAEITNAGDVSVYATTSVTGIGVYSGNAAAIYNTGDVTAVTSGIGPVTRALGLYATASYEVEIINSGDIAVSGGIGAVGIASVGYLAGARVVNTGDVMVDAGYFYTYYNPYYGYTEYNGGWAYGMTAVSVGLGVASVVNSGDIVATGITRGTGISAQSSFGSTAIYNTGDVTVSGQEVFAYGIASWARSREEFWYGETGYSNIFNSGDLNVSSGALAVGIQADQSMGNIEIYNTGDISAIVDNTGYGNAFGIVALNDYGDVAIGSYGDITVFSGGNAGGILVSSSGIYYGDYYAFPADITVLSEGALSVTSEYGRATGISASTRYGDIGIGIFGGSIDVSAYDRAFGVNAITTYGEVGIYNLADISVQSGNYNAVGLRALSTYSDATVYNYGDVDVQAAGLAQGIVALSYYGNVGVRNEGDVTASSSGGYSQAVALRSGTGYDAVLRNHGTITAGSGNAIAISITGGNGVISNYGDISGGMLTDAGDDYVRNYEGGRIFLTDDTIDLGGGYNYFLNEGRVYADGVNNVINMGYYGGGEGGYYGLFVNDGTSIHMNDGAADDALTIIGDFAGSGDLNVDVDGASLTSDMLYIYGNVLAGTANTINIDLLSLPSAADLNAGETITIVEVGGSSAETDFVLGDVNVAAGALFTADYSLLYDGNEFALGFDITGLSTAGVLLTSLSPAIQNLWFGSLGTMYQRQGGERQFLKNSGAADVRGAAGAWTRIYGSDGSITPSANRNNFGDAGSQDFSFGNDGLEFGVGYSFTQAWTAGLIGGLAKSTFRPDAGGRGELTANALGAYVTFTPGNGFYADLSYRDFSLDGEVNGPGVNLPVDGDASGYSLELGYGIKLKSGLEVEPQLQYSSVDVSLDDVGYNAGDFRLTDGDSDMFRAGVALRKSYEQNDGVWTPYTALSYVDVSSASNEYLIGGVLQGGVDLTGGSVLFELGTDAKYGDLLFNLGISVQDGAAYEFVYGGQLNIRYTF